MSTDDEHHCPSGNFTSFRLLVKLLICALIVLRLAETAYIIFDRHTINRFKPVDQDGYVAFDTATGQLCSSYRSKAPGKTARPAPTSSPSPQSESHSADPILAMIAPQTRAASFKCKSLYRKRAIPCSCRRLAPSRFRYKLRLLVTYPHVPIWITSGFRLADHSLAIGRGTSVLCAFSCEVDYLLIRSRSA
jgi:hypothetical protein